MNIETIKELWKSRVNNEAASIALWDGKAASFADRSEKTPTSGDSMLMRIIEQEGMLAPGSTVLDVGCGAGRYAFALEEKGAIVQGIDLSPRMIDYARSKARQRNSSVLFIQENWETLDLAGHKWTGAFDLAFAHMSPAISSAENFLKLVQASRNWGLLLKSVRRTNPVLDGIMELVLPQEKKPVLEMDLVYAFNILWLGGYCPKLEYEHQVWESKTPLEEAVESYTNRILTFQPIGNREKNRIADYLASRAKDGFVEERTEALIAALFWKTGDKKENADG